MERKKLIIVGAGDAALEFFAWASPLFLALGYDFKGFLDDYTQKDDIIGKIIDYIPQENDVFICAIGSPAGRIKCCRILREKGAVFINIIHPSSIVLSSIESTGVVIAPLVYVANHVKMANDVFLNVSVSVGHDVVIGQGSVLCPHSSLMGHVAVGEGVFFGTHACVIPRLKIGDFSTIGVGSAVIRHVTSGVTVVGVPAKKI